MATERLEEIRAERLKIRRQLIEGGQVPYPSEVRRTHTLAQVTAQFTSLADEQVPLVVVGRVMALRRHGGVVFLDLKDTSGSLQLQLTRDEVRPEFFERLTLLDVGDFIQASGSATTTARGVKTLNVLEFHIISKSIRPLPTSWYGLKDHETRYRQRELDLLLNTRTRHLLLTRTRVMADLRKELETRNFLEVETPILQPLAGGATAQPFTTHHAALDVSLYLRIAPELYLKRLLVGGLEKIFEIGRNFRNEGIGREHNPEFTMLELYWAYADYEDLMQLTEDVVTALVRSYGESEELAHGEADKISFKQPWKKQRYVEVMSELVGFNILEEKDPQAYEPVFTKHSLTLPEVRTYAKMIDELYKELIRPQLLQPTILYDYPVELAPLAKQNASAPATAEMFQVVVGGIELVKAYSELNDPVEQRARFESQQAARQAGDTEAQMIDESYLRAMEYGMPPAGGLGLGIDRLVMLLTNADSLRETITFPLLRPEQPPSI